MRHTFSCEWAFELFVLFSNLLGEWVGVLMLEGGGVKGGVNPCGGVNQDHSRCICDTHT